MSNSFFHQYFLKIILFLNLFIYFGCLRPSSLPGLFSSCGERVGFSLRWHLLFLSTGSTARGLSSCHLCAPETRLHSCGAQACGSVACGIFPDQGSNPNLLHWQANSSPLSHQGSPSSVHSYWNATVCQAPSSMTAETRSSLYDKKLISGGGIWRKISET